ncbi:hypothetical protein DUNSADRAFT_7829 [Dunaliella salina]|uniref:EF-hand domain-containing protein n=1 Tax=Dunaliella salina TaxID=3046 RepID=A0ABQ7GKM5_DUNSA|nr:hypothetical protein DUNSADRAFT_7829 [Dunaliella salina]|eukprot:KAF5835154.1 hypothetical protein DUNSADRAFT_7829 [Dunaliella salina]
MQAQEDYERRLREEMDSKSERELEIERLAELEMQLIERLKQKQMRQRKAYQQLEAVLALGSSTRKSSSKPSSPQVPPQASPPPPQEPTEEEVARAFSMYDTEASGEISTGCIDGLMRDLGVALAPSQLSQAIAQLDSRQCGKVSFGEFLLWWKG